MQTRDIYKMIQSRTNPRTHAKANNSCFSAACTRGINIPRAKTEIPTAASQYLGASGCERVA